MRKFHFRHGMIKDKILEIISFKKSNWFEKYISFKTKKRIRAQNIFEKDFYKLLNRAFYVQTMENMRNRLRLEFNKNMNIKS